MRQLIGSLMVLCLCGMAANGVLLKHWDFEGEDKHWTLHDKGKFSSFTADAAYKGTCGLRIVDHTLGDGSYVLSEPVPVKGETVYQLHLFVRTASDAHGVRVYWQFYDKDDKYLQVPQIIKECHAGKTWGEFDTYAMTPSNCHFLRFWIHSGSNITGDADFDELSLYEVDKDSIEPLKRAGKIAHVSWLKLDVVKQHIARIAQTPHPRLFANAADFAALKREAEGQGIRRNMRDKLCQLSDSIVNVAPVKREFDMSHTRILEMSRRAMYRISTLALSYKLTGKTVYRDRCLQEMRTIAAFEDWNPKHFLDTAEMTLALATGYDWLYDELSEKDRKVCGEAILQKGLLSGGPSAWWRTATNNWGQVCHAGMIAGAMAVAELNQEACTKVARESINNVAIPMLVYAPHGNYPEGPNYWEFGTGFNVIELAILDKAFGTDFGLSDQPGFKESGSYGDFMTGPSGLTCNFADCSNQGRSTLGSVWWFAKRFNQPELVETFDRKWLENYCASPAPDRPDRNVRWFHAYCFFWLFDRPDGVVPIDHRRLVWEGGGPIPVATMRNTWNPDTMAFIGMKGGRPNGPHGHMDGGSFIFDAARERWVSDLGMEWYARVEKITADLKKAGKKTSRWDLFRHNNFSHNTLAIDHKLQNPDGFATFVELSEKPVRAVMDLTTLYPDCKDAKRTFELAENGDLTVTDQITGLKAGQAVTWGITTFRDIVAQNETSVTLGSDKGRLAVTSHKGGTWKVFSVEKPGHPADSDNKNAKRVELTTMAPESGNVTIQVSLRLQ